MATTTKKKTNTRNRKPFLSAGVIADERRQVAAAEGWARDDAEHLRERSETREFRRQLRNIALIVVQQLPAMVQSAHAAYCDSMTPPLATWAELREDIDALKAKLQGMSVVEMDDDDVVALRSLTDAFKPRRSGVMPSVVPGGSPLAGPWAQLTLAVGDINANGKVDVSVTGEMAGRTFPRLVVDLDLGQAFSLFAGVKDAIGRAIENVTKGGR